MKRKNEHFGEYARRSPEYLLAHARFRDCLDVLNGDNSPQARILRMRAMLYLGEHHQVVRASFQDAIQHMPVAERARAFGLLSTAYFRSGMITPADNARREAYRYAGHDPRILAEIQYYDALQRWARNELEAAEQLIDSILPQAEWRAKALDLRSWVKAKRGDYRGQLSDLKEAYDAIVGEDVWEKAAILRAAAGTRAGNVR